MSLFIRHITYLNTINIILILPIRGNMDPMESMAVLFNNNSNPSKKMYDLPTIKCDGSTYDIRKCSTRPSTGMHTHRNCWNMLDIVKLNLLSSPKSVFENLDRLNEPNCCSTCWYYAHIHSCVLCQSLSVGRHCFKVLQVIIDLSLLFADDEFLDPYYK